MSAFLAFAQALQNALKGLQLYGSAHPSTVSGLEAVQTALNALNRETRGFRISVARGRLYFGKELQESGNLFVAALLKQMEERQIHGIAFAPGSMPEELSALFRILLLKPAQVLASGGAGKLLEGAQAKSIRIINVRLEEVGEDEDLVAVKGVAELMDRSGNTRLASEAPRGEAAGGGGGSGVSHAALIQGFLSGLARGGQTRVDLRGFGGLLEQLGLETHGPYVRELFQGSLKALPPDQRLSVLQGIRALPQGPLRQTLVQSAPPFVEASLPEAYAHGTIDVGALARAAEEILPLSPDPRNAFQKALDGLRRQGMSEAQIQEMVDLVTWEGQPFEDRIRKVLEGNRIFELPQDKVLSLLRELLEAGRDQEFLRLLRHYASGLHSPAVLRRKGVAEAFERIAAWVEVPGMPGPLLETLLEILRLHYGQEKDPEVHASTAAALEHLLWHWVQNGDPSRAHQEWEQLTDAVTGLHLPPAPWKAKATEQILARLGSAERIDKVLSLMFLTEREAAATEIHPYLAMLGAGAATHLAERLTGEQDRIRRGRLLEALKAMGDVALSPLMRSLASEEWFVVRNALLVVGEIATAKHVEAIAKTLHHKDARVLRAAITALWKLGGRPSEQHIAAQLRHTDPEIQMEALFCLGEMKAKNSATAIAELTKAPGLLQGGPPLKVRERAVETLGKLGTPFALDILAPLLKRRGLFAGSTEPFEIRVASARALKAFGTPEALRILAAVVEAEPKGPERGALEAIQHE